MSLDQISSKDLSLSNTTVVGSLRSRVSSLGPSKRPSIGVEQRVLLLETEPGDVLMKGKASFESAERPPYSVSTKNLRASLAASIALLAWNRWFVLLGVPSELKVSQLHDPKQ